MGGSGVAVLVDPRRFVMSKDQWIADLERIEENYASGGIERGEAVSLSCELGLTVDEANATLNLIDKEGGEFESGEFFKDVFTNRLTTAITAIDTVYHNTDSAEELEYLANRLEFWVKKTREKVEFRKMIDMSGPLSEDEYDEDEAAEIRRANKDGQG
jgi:hypothetical protein